ncbi:MAG: sugar phosphate isomerase/epimerase [Abitibacteriaceae bacterium]|nr:sugar phosphate isomerase/epimerase [Abditibacteriaceae bacterium]
MKLRSLLLTGLTLATLALPTLADEPVVKRDDSASEKLGMKLSLQCYTYRALTFFETVDKAAKMGIKYLESYPGQKLKPGADETVTRNMSDAECDEIKQKLKDAGGLRLIAYGVDSIPTDEAGARKDFDWAKKMGIEVLVTETTPNDVLDKLTQEYNIRMALHNHPQSWPPDDVLKAVQGHNKLIGSCSDTGHWMRRNLVPVEQFKKLEGRVEHSHFKDLNQFGDGHDVPWGTGAGNPRAMLEELKRQGYKGYLSIEYETGSVQDLDNNLPKCIAFFDSTMADLAK